MRRPALPRPLKRFLRDRRGVAAVEFALILPVMVLGYVGSVELSNAMMAQRRVSHSASALGDMIAQYPSVTQSNFNDIFNAAALIMSPFNSSTVNLRLTEFTYASSGKATVVWSEVNSGSSAWSETYTPKGTISSGTSTRDAQVTALLTQSGQTMILSEARYTYNSPIVYALASTALPGAMTFNDAFYLSPRSGTSIACSDC